MSAHTASLRAPTGPIATSRIVGTSTEASWALEDLHLLTEREWQKPEDVGHGINVQAALFLIHAAIKAEASQQRTAQMQKLHERLVASQSQGSKS